MCGRYTLTTPPAQLAERFGLTAFAFAPTPRYNVAPTQHVAVIYDETPTVLSSAKWGLIPSWSKDASTSYKMINARAETLLEKPSYKRLVTRKRCLILADSLYEWQKHADGTKTPMRIQLKDGNAFAFAGLWDEWKQPNGDRVRSCTMITGEPNELVAPIHNRLAIILQRPAERDWLNTANDNAGFLTALLTPYPASGMLAYAVSTRVNSVKNDDAELIQPV